MVLSGGGWMQSYSFEIWDGDTFLRSEVVCETDAESANRAALVALTLFLLKRPELRERLRISVRDGNGIRIGQCSASELRHQGIACKTRAVGANCRGRLGTRLLYGDLASEN